MIAAGPSTVTAGGAGRTLAGVLDLLAEAFLVPGADVRERACQLAAEAVQAGEGLAAVGAALKALDGTSPIDLDNEYVRLFLHGRPVTAHPYESFYRTGLLAAPECLVDLEELFTAAGVRPGEAGPAALDHLGIELDLLALLLHALVAPALEPRVADVIAKVASRLLRDHLAGFAVAFTARLAAANPGPYYRAAGALLASAIDAAGGLLSSGLEPLASSISRFAETKTEPTCGGVVASHGDALVLKRGAPPGTCAALGE
ncbi:MAG: molecular chaperone TorD family protein [Acidobacteriota bacterium]